VDARRGDEPAHAARSRKGGPSRNRRGDVRGRSGGKTLRPAGAPAGPVSAANPTSGPKSAGVTGPRGSSWLPEGSRRCEKQRNERTWPPDAAPSRRLRILLAATSAWLFDKSLNDERPRFHCGSASDRIHSSQSLTELSPPRACPETVVFLKNTACLSAPHLARKVPRVRTGACFCLACPADDRFSPIVCTGRLA
jgi:hypothetical protein